MNLASFAELAVRLVNSAVCEADADPLRSQESFREFVADCPFLAVQVTPADLGRLRLLRTDLAAVFTRAVEGSDQGVADRLNALLMIHPVHPVLVTHDDEPLHLHLSEAGSVTDRYAATTVASLSILVGQLGVHRLGICAIASCNRVYIDGSSNKSRRYCAEHSLARLNVTALPQRRADFTAEQSRSVTSAIS